MSRRVAGVHWAAAVTAAVACATAATLQAQDRAGYQDRITRLRAAVATLEGIEAREDSARQHSPLDTIRAGRLTVITLAESRPLVAAATDSALAALHDLLSDASVAARIRPILMVPTANRVRAFGPRPGEPVTSFYGVGRVRDVSRGIVDAVERQLANQLDDESADWIGHRVTLDAGTPGVRGHAYVRLVTTPSKTVRECFLGAIESCEDAFGFRRDSDAVLRWYDADEQRALVDRWTWVLQRLGSATEVIRCVEGKVAAACASLLRLLPPEYVHAPLTNETRQTLAKAAFTIGGEGAVGRFLSAAGPIEQRLEAAAGEPLDSVVTAWHADLLAAAPPAPTVARGESWAAFVWVVVFTTVALRSTRWRAT